MPFLEYSNIYLKHIKKSPKIQLTELFAHQIVYACIGLYHLRGSLNQLHVFFTHTPKFNIDLTTDGAMLWQAKWVKMLNSVFNEKKCD